MIRQAFFVGRKLLGTIAFRAALVFLCGAGTAWAQNNYELGKTYKGSVQVYSVESAQKVLYNIPVPDGEWRLIAQELFRTPGGNQMQSLALVTLDKDRVQSYVGIRAYVEEKFDRRWNDEPCKADAIYKNDHGLRLWQQRCLKINLQGFMPNADTPFRKQAIEYMNANKIAWSTSPIVMTYGQFGDQGKLMFVEYGIFPEQYGFANPRVSNQVQSPWHFTAVNNDPDRKKFIDAFVQYSEEYKKSLERAYKREPVQGSPQQFAFNNPNPVRVAQAAPPRADPARNSGVEAELRAKLEVEAKARVEAEAKIRAEIEARVAAESKAKAEAEARERLAKDQKDRESQEAARLAQEKSKIEADARAKAEAEVRDRLAREQKDRAAQENARLAQAQARIEAEARARAEAETRERLAREQSERAAQESARMARARVEAEARARAEADARERSVREQKEKGAQESTRLAALSEENARLRQQLARAEASAPGIRKALVIGNDNYKSVPKLQNAVEDAKAVAENLSKVGYSVTLRINLSEKDMKSALRVFKGMVNAGDEVAIFYAGHGVQLGAANYLLPTDVGGDNEEEVKDEAIPLQRILDDMTEKRAKFTLAMLDACRDNPFKGAGRSIGGNTRGLAPTSAATGQMVVFSAGTGQQALDRLGPNDKGKNGLFTRVFLQEMNKPGVSIDKIVRNVRTEVVNLAKTVGHEQVPAIYDQVVGEFYFSK